MFTFLNPVDHYIREIKEPTKSLNFYGKKRFDHSIHHFAVPSRSQTPSPYLTAKPRIQTDMNCVYHTNSFRLPPLKRRLHKEIRYYFGNDPKFELEKKLNVNTGRNNVHYNVPRRCNDEAFRQLFMCSRNKPRYRILKRGVMLERSHTMT